MRLEAGRFFASRQRRTARRAAEWILKVLCAPLPARVTNEELGDALERIERLACRHRGLAFFTRAAAILASSLFAMVLNSLRELRASGTGPGRRGGGSDV
jgi:hypothetical protein